MVEIAELQIGGSIDVEAIESGLVRVGQSFDIIESKTSGLNSDFERMNNEVKELGRGFGILAITGAGSIIAIAKGAPAVAGAMAKIQIAAMKLKFAIGEALKEEFNWFGNKLNEVAGWVQENPDLFGLITTSVIGLAAAFTVFKVGGVIAAGIGGLLGITTGLLGLFASPAFLAGVAALAAAAGLWTYVSNLSKTSQAQAGFYAAAGVSQAEVAQAGFQGYQGTIFPGMLNGTYSGGGLQNAPQMTPQMQVDIIESYLQSTGRTAMGKTLKDTT